MAQRLQLTFVLLLGPCCFDSVTATLAGGRLGLSVPQDGAQGAAHHLVRQGRRQPPAPRRGGRCRQGIGGELHVLPPELYEKPGRRYNLQQQGHDDLRGRPQGFPPSSREVPLQRRGVQVPTALHQERPRVRLGER